MCDGQSSLSARLLVDWAIGLPETIPHKIYRQETTVIRSKNVASEVFLSVLALKDPLVDGAIVQ